MSAETKLPCSECKGRCCTFPTFSPSEWETVKLLRGVPRGTLIREVQLASFYQQGNVGQKAYVPHLKDGTCPYLKDGACSIYTLRPKVCRDYGVAPDLPCEYVEPERAAAQVRAMMEKARKQNNFMR